MSADYKPGTIARTTRGGTVARTAVGTWILLDDGHRITLDHEPRPLLVLDPDDVEQVKTFRDWLGSLNYYGTIGQLQSSLRQMAQPPKPPEPGKYGAVIAADGREWFRWTTSERDGRDWCRPGTTGGTEYARWDDLNVVQVTNEGVQP